MAHCHVRGGAGRVTRHKFAVALCFDHAYLRHACATLASIVTNAGIADLQICVLVDGLDSNDFARLHRVVRDRAELHVVHFADVADCLPSGKSGPGYISDAAYLRLWLPIVFAGLAEYMLYMDADTLCIGGLGDLRAGEILDGRALGAVQDAEILDMRHLSANLSTENSGDSGEGYFNSGVLVFDMNEFVRLGLAESAIRLAFAEGSGFRYGDQDVLNIISRGHWTALPTKFNCMDYWSFRSDAAALAADVRIVHAAGSLKFWHADFPIGLRRQLYWRGVRKSMTE